MTSELTTTAEEDSFIKRTARSDAPRTAVRDGTVYRVETTAFTTEVLDAVYERGFPCACCDDPATEICECGAPGCGKHACVFECGGSMYRLSATGRLLPPRYPDDTDVVADVRYAYLNGDLDVSPDGDANE